MITVSDTKLTKRRSDQRLSFTDTRFDAEQASKKLFVAVMNRV